MKILITQYEMMDLGGIVNDLEALVYGLQELGHEVTVRQLCWKYEVKDQRSQKTNLQVGYLGIPHDQTGWIWPASMRFPYKGKLNTERFREFASSFDLVIWHIPVPSKNAQNKGNDDWLDLYQLPISTKQVAYCHDGNFWKSYPWFIEISGYLAGVVATQGAAYGSLRKMPIPRALILSGQVGRQARQHQRRRPWAEKLPGFYSNFTAKGWKHLEDLVRAIPFMNSHPKIYAGNGITLRYMKSMDKCKPEFYWRSHDLDFQQEFMGRKIWDVALEYGLKHMDYVHPEERDEMMSMVRLHIDPSWSKNYYKIGPHFNRTTVESAIVGTVPVARDLGISSEHSELNILKEGEHYIGIPYNASPKEFADIVYEAQNMSESEYETIIGNWDSILHHWDAENVAQSIIDLVEDKPAGVFGDKNSIGETDQTIEQKSWDALENHFYEINK